MPRCPSCGSTRWISAPLPVVSWIMLLTRKRRYSCAFCAGISWERGLRRRTITVRSSPERRELRGREIAFFVSVILASIIGVAVAVQSCRTLPGDPPPPEPTPAVTPVVPGR